MKAKHDRWNRCDACGRFIPYGEFDSGKATRHMVTPDSDYSSETWDTLCAACKKRGETHIRVEAER